MKIYMHSCLYTMHLYVHTQHYAYACTLLYVAAIIGIFYCMLGNIDPKYRSNLHVIQLLCVVTTPLLKKYGINQILEPLMTDIKELESVSAHVIHKLILFMLHLNYIYRMLVYLSK